MFSMKRFRLNVNRSQFDFYQTGNSKVEIEMWHGSKLFFRTLLCSPRDTDEGPADSFTMVTIDALGDDDVARFHNRQPMFLDRDRADTWLDLPVDPAPILKGPTQGYQEVMQQHLGDFRGTPRRSAKRRQR